MSTPQLLQDHRLHLAGLLEAIQRCVFFLDASTRDIVWPLTGEFLQAHKKDNALFEALAAVNERFAKLQDTLGSAMRHSLILSGAHDYETDYEQVAQHFNSLHSLTPDLFAAAYRFVKYSADVLGVGPLSSDFAPEFEQITSPAGQRS